jgi:hypothetical protein
MPRLHQRCLERLSAKAHGRREHPALPRIVSGLLLSLAIITLPVARTDARAAAQQAVVPNDLQLLMMIKTTLIAFSQANVTGNYSVLRDLAAPTFQQTNSTARLGEIFRDERNKNLDLSPVVLLRPELLRRPSIDANGMLHVEGYFPSKPQMVHFVLVFQNVADRWRLVALGVTTFTPTPEVAARPSKETVAYRGAGNPIKADEFVQSWAGKWPSSWSVGLR